MDFLVIYDSQFGNTKLVAEAIARGLSGLGNGSAINVDSFQLDDLDGSTLLVVGSPTQRFSATAKIKKWLDNLPRNKIAGIHAAAFDTRFPEDKIAEVGMLSFLVSIFGYGSEPIARRLRNKGAALVADPVGFYVADTEGPLLDQELARAEKWASQLRKAFI